GQIFNDLCVADGTKSGNYQSLRFTTGEQRGAVSLAQHAHFNIDRTNGVVVTTVDTWLTSDDAAANDFLLERRKHALNLRGSNRRLSSVAGELFDGLSLECGQTIVTLHLVGYLVGSGNFRIERSAN